MVNNQQISACFAGLVGFPQRTDPAYPIISSNLTASSSGMYVKHALCTVENIYNIAPEFGSFTYPEWVDGAYAKDAVVTFADKTYISKIAIAEGLGDPATYLVGWRIFDGFNEWLQDIYNRASVTLANELVKYKKLSGIGRSLLDSLQLFQGFGNLNDRIIKKSRFVGLEFQLNAQENIQVKIDQLGFQVDEVQNDLLFYLYHSSQLEPLGTFSVDITRASSFSWFPMEELIMGYLSEKNDTSGRFLLGYYEDDLTGQAISREMDFSRAPCATCIDYNIKTYRAWSKHVRIAAFEIPSTGINEDKTLPDLSKVAYYGSSNYGLNLTLTITCDLTEIMCRNKSLFAEALAMQISLDILEKIAFSTNINVIADKTKALAMAELDDKDNSGSYKAQFIGALKALNLDFSGFSSDCLPCVNKRGYTFGTI